MTLFGRHDRTLSKLALSVHFFISMLAAEPESQHEGIPLSRLANGQPFPQLDVAAVGGGTLNLPGDLAGSYGVILMYRGSWCPYCIAQLGGFSRALDSLTELSVKVVALSVDDEDTSAALVAKRALRFPVGHSADAGKVAEAVGAYVNDDRHYLESTGFILAPDGTVRLAVYSSGAIGRLVPDDVAGFIRYLTKRPQAQ